MASTVEISLAAYAADLENAPRVWVAFSGGLDSTLLLNLAAEILPSSRLVALHINHGLHADADRWQHSCFQEATRLEVPFQAVKVQVNSGNSMEAEARERRYEVFEEKLAPEELLLMAHHANDQAETFLFRMMRGAGLRGLSGMPERRPLGEGYLLRPLLPYSKQQLQELARERGLSWIEDPSNTDLRHSRNYLRHRIVPELEQRWPSAGEKINQTVSALKEAAQLLDLYAQDLSAGCDLASAAYGVSLELHKFNAFDMAQRQLLLRHLLAIRGEYPDSRRLDDLLGQLEAVDSESQIEDRFNSIELRVFQYRLYLLEPHAKVDHDKVCTWDALTDLVIPGVGRLEASAELAEHGPFSVSFRQGGERCQPLGRDHSQSLKKLFQEYQMPPWLREITPLIYRNNELVAVAGLFSCSEKFPPPLLEWRAC